MVRETINSVALDNASDMAPEGQVVPATPPQQSNGGDELAALRAQFAALAERQQQLEAREAERQQQLEAREKARRARAAARRAAQQAQADEQPPAYDAVAAGQVNVQPIVSDDAIDSDTDGSDFYDSDSDATNAVKVENKPPALVEVERTPPRQVLNSAERQALRAQAKKHAEATLEARLGPPAPTAMKRSVDLAYTFAAVTTDNDARAAEAKEAEALAQLVAEQQLGSKRVRLVPTLGAGAATTQ